MDDEGYGTKGQEYFFYFYHQTEQEKQNDEKNTSKNTVWTESNSPYYVVGTVGVPKGITLTIEAGVKVVFQQDYGILIKEGVLKSLGTKTQPVSFTSALHSNKSMITFKATNLSESVIQATQFSGPKSSIVLGVIEDDPQDNYGILVLEFCLFINTIINNGNSTRPTWQYSDYTKKILSIVLRDTIILNSTFFCGYGNIQSIYMKWLHYR
ncbi:hypothetical protein I4U23_001323 [Adineta vaga]|nr:hypothetical protein I4U23_001323 [Adineta vaga]